MESRAVHPQLLIIGAGGHGRVVADIALKTGKWRQVGFLDDDATLKSPIGIKVIGRLNEVTKYGGDHDILVAIGNNQIRERVQSQLESAGFTLPTLIHPRAIIGERVEAGPGTVIMAGTVINCGSVIGKGCIVNTGATIDHDNRIADYVHISPGVHLAGTVAIGRRTWLGIGTAVSNNVKIIEDCVVGAGAVVVRDIIETGTYIGVPARKI